MCALVLGGREDNSEWRYFWLVVRINAKLNVSYEVLQVFITVGTYALIFELTYLRLKEL